MKRLLLPLLLCLISTLCSAQEYVVQHLPYVDQRMVHLGFSLGTHTQDLAITHSGVATESGEAWWCEVPNFSPGFNVSIVGDLYLNPCLNLRLSPGIYFGNKTLHLREGQQGDTKKVDIKSTYINLPLDIKYSAMRINNYKPYLLAGVGASYDISKQEGLLIRTNPFDLFWEIGVGCDLYLYYFKLIPELKFSFGLRDLVKRKRPDLQDPADIKYSDSIARASSRMVTLSFYFE